MFILLSEFCNELLRFKFSYGSRRDIKKDEKGKNKRTIYVQKFCDKGGGGEAPKISKKKN